MSERPILFSGPMVRAILDGRKTVTRRIVKPSKANADGFVMLDHGNGWWPFNAFADFTSDSDGMEYPITCPYGQPGDRLWVREAHSIHPTHGQRRLDGERWGPWGGLPTTISPDGKQIAYFREGFDRCDPGRWRPSIHMPRWASRILLEVTAVRCERLQDISYESARAEGVQNHPDIESGKVEGSILTSKALFECLWCDINGDDSWFANPWVWVVEFKRVEQGGAA